VKLVGPQVLGGALGEVVGQLLPQDSAAQAVDAQVACDGEDP
jgi:hypothetical protein